MAHALRLARAEDEDAVSRLTCEAYASYIPIIGYEPLPMAEDYGRRIAAGEVWLLEMEGALAGLLVLERHDGHALIYSVAVDPARHGHGFGSVLLDAAEAKALIWGVPRLLLYTNAKMERNQAIYAARGFRETGRRPVAGRPGFMLVDMEKAL